MSKTYAKKIVKRYEAALKEANYPFSAIYLFGSYAKGDTRKESDIDIAVLSNRFKRDWNKNEEILWKLGASIDARIEPVGFTPEDFEKGADPIAREIKKTGVKLA